MSTTWRPKGFHTITPNIVVENAEQAIAFLKKALGFTESYRLTTSDGKVSHCELKLGEAAVTWPICTGETMASTVRSVFSCKTTM